MNEGAVRLPAGKQKAISVCMLGTFCVYWDGKPIIGLFRSGMTQPAAALQMILHYRQSGVSKSQLIDYLFEDRDVQNATHSLHVQLHNLRRMLRQAGLPDTNYFRRENDTYFWTPEIPVREDAEEFERICDDVRKAGSGQEELRLCLQACQVYGGDFFGVRTNNGWAAQEARRYEQLFIDCTERAAGRLRENRNYTELERLGQHASRVQPFFDWERLTMEALIEQGRYAEAKKLYMITEQNYRTDMDLPVGRQMTELYQKLPITDAAAASDPGRLWKQMTGEEKEGGAYLCSTPVFEGICRMEKRRINRREHPSFLLYVALNPSPGQPPETENGPQDSTLLRDALVQAARPVDALTEISRGRFLVLLADAGEEECVSVFRQASCLYRENGGQAELTQKIYALKAA